MSSKNIQTELKELRNKVRLLKKSNNFENESSKNAPKPLNWESNLINGKTYIDVKRKNEWETKQLINDDEAFIVANCYRKSLELVKKHFKKKSKKHKIKNFGESVTYSCNENISTNYAAELSNIPSYVKEHNISSQLRIYGVNQTTSQSEDANCHVRGNACVNSQKKTNKTVENKKDTNVSSALSKLAVNKYSQNELEAQMKEINIETALSDDVVILETVIHSGERKKKSKSLTKTSDKNKIYNKTSNAFDKKKQHPNISTEHEKFEHTQHYHEIKQKETEDPDIVYLNTVNVSPLISLKDKNCKQINNNRKIHNSTNCIENNALQSISDQNNLISLFHNKCDSFSSFQATKKIFQDSQHNENWLSPPELKTNCLIDLSSEEEEPETIVPLWDFTEEPVDFTVPALHISEMIVKFTEQNIKLLESKGIVIKRGKWSQKEKALLTRNYENFVHQFGLNDARLLLGIGRYCSDKHENGNVRKFLRAKHFFVRLGKDINHRSLRCIYLQARQLFDPLRFKRKTGQNDISYLLQLQKKHGNKWELIAKKFGRPARYCKDLYLDKKKCYTKGKWSNEEIEHLIYAVKKVLKSSYTLSRNVKSFSWVKVSELLKTRSPRQCYKRWNYTYSKS